MPDSKATSSPASQPTPPPALAPGTPANQAATDIFTKLKAHMDPVKVDAWQKKWLSMPENRTKYQTLKDAPAVVGEELLAMSNDIIDFIQGQPGGKSEALKKFKASLTEWFGKGKTFLKTQWAAMQSTAKKPESAPAPTALVTPASGPAVPATPPPFKSSVSEIVTKEVPRKPVKPKAPTKVVKAKPAKPKKK